MKIFRSCRGRSTLGVALALLAAAGLAGAGAWAWPRLVGVAADPGRSAYARGDYAAALEIARARVRERRDDMEALRLLARASARRGRDDVAQAIYGRLDPGLLEAEDCYLLAAGLVRQDRLADAGVLLQKALERDPDHAEALDQHARLLAASDRLAEAVDLADRLIRRPGWEARGHVLLGLIRHAVPDPAGAVAAFQSALRLDPHLSEIRRTPAEIRQFLARDLLASGRPAEARRALEVLSGTPEADWLLSRIALQEGRPEAAAASLERARGREPGSPLAPEPAPYVGAEACAPCHREIYDAQQAGHHATTFYPGDRIGELPLPDAPLPDPAAPEVSHAFLLDGHGRHAFEARRGERNVRALIEFAFGSGDRGATPVGVDDAGQVRELRLSHYGGVGWDVTTGHPKAPEGGDDDLHAYLGEPLRPDALRRCVGCHTTDTHSALAGTGPAARDRGIGCERCHGPGAHHVASMNAAPKFPDLAIARPSLASPDEVNDLCARCHSPRGLTVSRADPTAIRFQGSTLRWSRCYTESRGSLSCVSCHDPHRDAETSPAYYEAKCLACHAPDSPPPHPPDDGARPIALADGAPRTPCPVSPSSGCVDCHMPTKKDVLPHTTFTDHFIRVHEADAAAD